MGRWRKPTKEQRERREQWHQEHRRRIKDAHAPNTAYITDPEVLAVLQHLADGVNEALMARPLTPFPWLGDYLRHACKLAYCIEQDAATVLVGEMHKKRRVIQNALLDTKTDELESKQLIRAIQMQQETLSLPDDELVLGSDDNVFLHTEIPRHQSLWSIDVSTIPMPSSSLAEAPNTVVNEWIETHLLPRRHIEEYASVVMNGVTHALVEMEIVAPENCAEWLVLHFKHYEHQATTSDPRLTLFLNSNYELMRKIDGIKHEQRDMHLRRKQYEQFLRQLDQEIVCRQHFIDKLRVCHTTTRTHAIMRGTPCFLDDQKVWILPGCLLVPDELKDDELVGLRRAERFLMEEDEKRWRFLLLSQKQYDAATQLQATWRCVRDYRVYEAIKAQRHKAATTIQRNYFSYLYHRAISLPTWCVLGREVLVAHSVAMQLAITFQFYPRKDFSTGNFKRLEGKSVSELMEICRQDEGCAAFATDGSLKRFVPRQLSQLKEMTTNDNQPLTMHDGIYIKVFPAKTAKIVTTGIVIDVPVDRFGMITVVLDGTGVVESLPIQKLSDRWKRIRVRRNRPLEKKRKAFVFGRKTIVESELEDERTSITDYEVVVEDDEQAERRERLQRRVRLQSNEQEATPMDFVYKDRATNEVRDREPHCTYSDPNERAQVIEKRKQEYAIAQAKAFETKKLQSVIRLQCAWRSKRAREAFRQILQLRAKEKERDKVVQAMHKSKSNQRKHEEHHGKPGFFARWRR